MTPVSGAAPASLIAPAGATAVGLDLVFECRLQGVDPTPRLYQRKLLHHSRGRNPIIGREALRALPARHGVTFQRTKTWKDSPDPDVDAKLDRIECALTQRPERTFAFDEFGPSGIRPAHGITYFHGCYSVGDDLLWGMVRRRKGIDHTWAALRSIRAARPDGGPIHVILDNLSAHKNRRILAWA